MIPRRLMVGKVTPSLATNFSWVSPVRSRSSRTDRGMSAWAINVVFLLDPIGTLTKHSSYHTTRQMIHHTIMSYNVKSFRAGSNRLKYERLTRNIARKLIEYFLQAVTARIKPGSTSERGYSLWNETSGSRQQSRLRNLWPSFLCIANRTIHSSLCNWGTSPRHEWEDGCKEW